MDKIENISNDKIIDAVSNNTIHLIAGGPPCNGFSVAGYRNPKDPRNLYFREFIRFLKVIRPNFFMMEISQELSSLESYLPEFEINGRTFRQDFDYLWFTSRQDTEDPCEAFRKQSV